MAQTKLIVTTIFAEEKADVAEFKVQPRTLALLNVDLQNVFVKGSPSAAPDGLAVVERVNRLSAPCRQLGVPVAHTLT